MTTGDAQPVAGEARWMTSLVGMDGRRRTAGVRAKVAEAEYLAWAHSIVDHAPRGLLEVREAEHEDYLCRMAVARLRRAPEAT